jgi:hypothetical protein
MGNYTYTKNDPWIWTRATAMDVPKIVQLVDQNYSQEIDSVIFKKNPTRLSYHLHKSILDISYGINNELINIATDPDTKKLLAWGWVTRGKYTVYADEEMAVAEFAHVDLSLSIRTKIKLIAQILEQWRSWCEINSIPVLCSTSIREDQAGFMRLHDQYGFVRRGSFAYLKIDI